MMRNMIGQVADALLMHVKMGILLRKVASLTAAQVGSGIFVLLRGHYADDALNFIVNLLGRGIPCAANVVPNSMPPKLTTVVLAVNIQVVPQDSFLKFRSYPCSYKMCQIIPRYLPFRPAEGT